MDAEMVDMLYREFIKKIKKPLFDKFTDIIKTEPTFYYKVNSGYGLCIRADNLEEIEKAAKKINSKRWNVIRFITSYDFGKLWYNFCEDDFSFIVDDQVIWKHRRGKIIELNHQYI